MKKMLVVDDSQNILHFFQEIGSILKVEITTKASGLEALELLKTQTFDFLFIDVNMPEINGIDVVRKVLQKPAHPKIILMSGIVSVSEIPKEILQKIDFLPKPFSIKDIEELIKTI